MACGQKAERNFSNLKCPSFSFVSPCVALVHRLAGAGLHVLNGICIKTTTEFGNKGRRCHRAVYLFLQGFGSNVLCHKTTPQEKPDESNCYVNIKMNRMVFI